VRDIIPVHNLTNGAMANLLPNGLYDQLLTDELAARIGEHRADQLTLGYLGAQAAPQMLVNALSEQLGKILQDMPAGGADDEEQAGRQAHVDNQLDLINGLLVSLRAQLKQRYPNGEHADSVRLLTSPARHLTSIHRERPAPAMPDTGVATPWLFAASKSSPSLLNELRHELSSSDRVDILMSFITVSGVRKIRDILHGITAMGSNGQSKTRLRVLTTTYIGATEAQAVDELARLPGCEIRVSLDGRRTRLHAKAWIFERDSGFGTVYVGSANLTQAAMAGGLEWTAKFTQSGQADMYTQAQAHFETLWHDSEFFAYHPDSDGHRLALDQAISRERGGYKADNAPHILRFFDLQPKNYQREMLEQLQTERAHGRARNLVVAATGTGKTVIAAFDYQRTCEQRGGRPRLLFIAHRVEILQQAVRTFREVLRDPSFGEHVAGGIKLGSPDHLFVTIDSLHAQDLVSRYGEDYWHTVVFDECHRMAAASFDAVATRIRPEILLGLTATPERSDGKPILKYFDCRPDGSPAVEMRLWHALDLQLLAPFEYFACDDETDLRDVPWNRAEEQKVLDKLFTGNDFRARLIVNEWRRLCANPRESRAVAFCVSVNHARFMTEQFIRAGLPALCLTGQSSRQERESAPRKLASGEVCVLVTVDLYNEGVDLPMVDTLLMLRPTQSPVLFQQQVGRGLRLFKGKESCLVLDFVGQHQKEYRFDHLLGHLTGLSRRGLLDGVENGFGMLPTGCYLHLQKRTRDQVLVSLRNLIQQNWRRLIRELLTFVSLHGRSQLSLPRFLHEQALGLSEVYRRTGHSGWTALQRAAELLSGIEGPEEGYFARRFTALLHIDDPEQIALMQALARPGCETLLEDPRCALRLQMLAYQVDGTADRVGSGADFLRRLQHNPHSLQELAELAQVLQVEALARATTIPGLEDVPLCLHAHYRVSEILTAVGYLTAEKRPRFGEGVLRLKERKTELLFVTLDKRSGYHDAISYHDYAISHTLFHWQTQNSCSPTSASGQRYLQSVGVENNGWQFQLFVRSNPESAYLACGPVMLDSASGTHPMNINWLLQQALPAAAFAQFSVLRCV
jgi:superfamily II DNA or RNA helicase/HKD family nuclease